MAKAKAKAKAKGSEQNTATVSPMEKIALLLALLVIKDTPKEEAALQLSGAGFSAKEIANLLSVSENYLHVVKNRRKDLSKKTRKA